MSIRISYRNVDASGSAFIWLYEAFATGVVQVKSFERTREESFFWFHVFVFYKIILAAFLVWLGTGGAKEKLDDGGEP